MELVILKTLKFKLNPPTINFWLNWYLSQWDVFIDTYPKPDQGNFLLIQFKQPN